MHGPVASSLSKERSAFYAVDLRFLKGMTGGSEGCLWPEGVVPADGLGIGRKQNLKC